MRRITAAVVGLAVLAGVGLTADPPAPAAAPGKLPTHYKQLGLSADQKAQVEKITGTASAQLHELEAQIAAIRDKEHADCLAVLTEAQRKQLAQLATGQKPDASTAPDKTKP